MTVVAQQLLQLSMNPRNGRFYRQCIQSAATTSGTSEGKAFYDLTEYCGDGSDVRSADEGLLLSKWSYTR